MLSAIYACGLRRSELLNLKPQDIDSSRGLFEGIEPGIQYDERSLQQVLKKALLLSKIKKPVTLHWLRHSYATHLHESGGVF
jgi:integrase/recombinase XerD